MIKNKECVGNHCKFLVEACTSLTILELKNMELKNEKAELLNLLDGISEQRIFEYDSMDRNSYLENKVHHILDKYKRD